MRRDNRVNDLIILAAAAFSFGENCTIFIVRCVDGRYTGTLALVVILCAIVALIVGARAFARLAE